MRENFIENKEEWIKEKDSLLERLTKATQENQDLLQTLSREISKIQEQQEENSRLKKQNQNLIEIETPRIEEINIDDRHKYINLTLLSNIAPNANEHTFNNKNISWPWDYKNEKFTPYTKEIIYLTKSFDLNSKSIALLKTLQNESIFEEKFEKYNLIEDLENLKNGGHLRIDHETPRLNAEQVFKISKHGEKLLNHLKNIGFNIKKYDF